MRIVTWNCCRGALADKLAAAESLEPDLLVMQEARRPDAPRPNHLWFGDNPLMGTLVAGYRGVTVSAGPRGAGKSAFAAVVGGPASFHLLAVWTKPRPSYVGALDAALTRHRRFLAAAPAVVAGDFNSNVMLDRPRTSAPHARLVRRLEEELGLVSAYHAHHGIDQGMETHPTHYWTWQEAMPFHIDFCFVPKSARITGVAVGGYGEWRGLSDHRPLVVDCELDG